MSIVASNFKTNHTRKSTASYISVLNDYLEKSNYKEEVYVFPTSCALDEFKTVSNLNIGVQNAYPVKNGSFTGEIALEQIEEFKIKTILIGHSERRHILGENQEEIAKKYEFYKNLGFTIIYCIGEPLEVKNAGLDTTLEYIYEQFIGIDTNYENLILAYEPVWAIGTGITATKDDILKVHSKIKEKISKPLLYGGSVKVENAKELCSLDNVDGVLVGTASWKIDDFIQILENTKDVKC